MRKCLKCGSFNVKVADESGLEFLICNKCGYDELEDEKVFPEKKVSQREKARHSPYKTGGKNRIGN